MENRDVRGHLVGARTLTDAACVCLLGLRGHTTTDPTAARASRRCSRSDELALAAFMHLAGPPAAGGRLPWRRGRLTLLVLVVFVGEGVCGAKPRPWHLSTHNLWAHNLPRASMGHAMVTGSDQAIYVFGGRKFVAEGESKELASNKLYKLDVDMGEWTAIMPSGPSPSVMTQHRMCSVGDSLYLFGGETFVQDADGTRGFIRAYSGELWRLSLLSLRWRQMPAAIGVPTAGTRDERLWPARYISVAMTSVGDNLYVLRADVTIPSDPSERRTRPRSNVLMKFSTSRLQWSMLDPELDDSKWGHGQGSMVALGSDLYIVRYASISLSQRRRPCALDV